MSKVLETNKYFSEHEEGFNPNETCWLSNGKQTFFKGPFGMEIEKEGFTETNYSENHKKVGKPPLYSQKVKEIRKEPYKINENEFFLDKMPSFLNEEEAGETMEYSQTCFEDDSVFEGEISPKKTKSFIEMNVAKFLNEVSSFSILQSESLSLQSSSCLSMLESFLKNQSASKGKQEPNSQDESISSENKASRSRDSNDSSSIEEDPKTKQKIQNTFIEKLQKQTKGIPKVSLFTMSKVVEVNNEEAEVPFVFKFSRFELSACQGNEVNFIDYNPKGGHLNIVVVVCTERKNSKKGQNRIETFWETLLGSLGPSDKIGIINSASCTSSQMEKEKDPMVVSLQEISKNLVGYIKTIGSSIGDVFKKEENANGSSDCLCNAIQAAQFHLLMRSEDSKATNFILVLANKPVKESRLLLEGEMMNELRVPICFVVDEHSNVSDFMIRAASQSAGNVLLMSKMDTFKKGLEKTLFKFRSCLEIEYSFSVQISSSPSSNFETKMHLFPPFKNPVQTEKGKFVFKGSLQIFKKACFLGFFKVKGLSTGLSFLTLRVFNSTLNGANWPSEDIDLFLLRLGPFEEKDKFISEECKEPIFRCSKIILSAKALSVLKKESFKELDDLFQISERMQKEKKLIRKWVEEIERNGKEPKTGSQKIKKALGKVMKMEKAKKIEDLAQAIRLNIFYFMRTNTS